MPAKPPDPQRDARILAAARAGLASGELAARFGISPSAVRDALRRAQAAAAAGATAAAQTQEARP